MTRKYTDEDVRYLVDECIRHIKENKRAGTHLASLEYRLKPFLPDPEEELISAMVDAYTSSNDFHHDRDLVFNRMRKAYSVVKERGLPQ